MPKFSVIIPLYNKETDITTTLKSVINQSFKDFEIIIVDDGSTDCSVKKVKTFKDKRLKLFLKQNEGVAKTRNYGVVQAKSPYVAFLDADDYWHPTHLENINTLINSFPKEKWYATAYEKQYNATQIQPMRSPILKKGAQWQGVVTNYFKYSFADALAWTSAVCFKTSFFNTLNGFDATITHGAGEDTDLWVRAALASNLVFSNSITARHNLDSSNRISFTETSKRQFFNPDKYTLNASASLKKYLDLNRFAIAMHYKLDRNPQKMHALISGITKQNLSTTQWLLLKLPRVVVTSLKKWKYFLARKGWHLSAFRL